jgi:hypothetical protein
MPGCLSISSCSVSPTSWVAVQPQSRSRALSRASTAVAQASLGLRAAAAQGDQWVTGQVAASHVHPLERFQHLLACRRLDRRALTGPGSPLALAARLDIIRVVDHT